MRLRYETTSWEQSAPGRGLEPVRVVKTGTIVERKNGTVLVRPDDNVGSLILMADPAAPRAKRADKKALSRERAKYRRNM